MSEETKSLDDMNEDELIEAFKEAQQPKEEDVEESPVEQPSEATEEEAQTADEPLEPVEEEDSSDNIQDEPRLYKLKDRDLEMDATEDEMMSLAQKGLNFTRKTQELAKHKSTIDYMSQHGIDMETLQTLAEAKSGNKEAFGKLAKDAGIDVFDVDQDANYQPKQEFAPMQYSEVDMVAEEIQAKPEVADKFRGMMGYAPDSFKQQLAGDADTLRKFAIDVENGVAEQLMPEAIKLHALNGGDFVQSYIEAGNKVFGGQQQPQQEVAPVQETAPREPSPNRDKATVASPNSSTASNQSFDVWEASDEELMNKIAELSRR